MKIFDTHTHVFPDKIAAQVIAHLREISSGIPAYTKGTFADLAQRETAAGVSGWMNCPVATRPGQAQSVNDWVASHNNWPSLSLGAIHPLDVDKTGILHRIKELGLYGVKLHPEYQEFGMFDSNMEEVWKTCEELALPVLIHGGEDIGFAPPYHSKPADYVELSRRHPALVIIAAHAGGWNLWDEVERDLVGSNVLIDTSFSVNYMKDKTQLFRIIRAHGAKKVLFGTDSPWQELCEAAEQVRNCGLTQEELEDIFWNNAKRVWGFTE